MSGEDASPPAGSPPRFLRWAVAGSALLMVASGALFYYASRNATPPVRGEIYRVAVGDKTCDPNDITVPAGRTTFEIRNASNRTLEWEILDGVMVVEERENIAPGFRATLTARLKPGHYQITCGLLSNPRGTLTVTASAQSDAERERPPLEAFIGPLSEYRVFTMLQASVLMRETRRLADAIRSGNLEAAREAYRAARLPYRRLDGVTARFSDLENAIDPLADYLAERESDPGFTGFHRIEYGLFGKATTQDLQPVADRLVTDIAALAARIKSLRLAPADLGAGVERQARFLTEGQIPKGENRYGRTDLEEFEAALEGMEKPLDLLPAASGGGGAAAASIAEARTGLRRQFAALKSEGTYPGYDRVSTESRERLGKGFLALSEAAGRLNSALGLD